jgi:glycosyltransferase involved in cell wall biosynthesis
VTEQPTFTIVMAAYNAAGTVESAIRSVLAQTRGDFELIVVDDGSTDETAARVQSLQSDGRIRLLRQANRGLAVARNAGIREGRGRLVSILDSDDLWLPGNLEAMARALDADPEAGFAYTDAWVLDDRTRRVQRASAMAYQDPPETPPTDPEQLLAELIRRNFVFTSATVRRSILEEVGPYRESLGAAEDYELWLRIVAHGYRAARVPGLLAVYRKRAGTLSTNELLMVRSLREVFHVVAEEYEVRERIRALARKRRASFDADLSADGRRLSVRYRLRRRLVELKRALLSPWLWRRTPPAELIAAFPDLETV